MSDFLFSRVKNGWLVTLSSEEGTEQAVFADGHSGDAFYDPAESLQRAIWMAFGTYMAGKGHAGLDVGVHAAPEPEENKKLPLSIKLRRSAKQRKPRRVDFWSESGQPPTQRPPGGKQTPKPRRSKQPKLTIVPVDSP